MKKLTFLTLFGFLVNFGFSQSAPLIPSTKITINSVTVFTDPYTVVGTTNDVTSNWVASDISAGDSVYLEDGNELRVYYVQSITSASGTNFTIVINDMNNTGNIPPTGVGALYRGTINYDFPNFTAGISESLQTMIQNRFVQRLDALLKGLGSDYITTDSFTTFTNGALFSAIPIGKTVWRTTTGSKFEKTSSTAMTVRSTDNGLLATTIPVTNNDTILFNSRLNNRVRMNTGNVTTARISDPLYYFLQPVGETFVIDVQAGSSNVTLSWGSAYGVYTGTSFSAMPTTVVPAQSIMSFTFRVITTSAEIVRFQYVDNIEASVGSFTPSNFDVLYTGQSNMVGVNYVDHPPSPPVFWQTNPRTKVQMPNGTFQVADPTVGNVIPNSAANIINIPFLFGTQYAREHPYDTVRMVGFAGGGLSIERWTPATSGSAGETSDNFCLDSLILKLNRMPSGTDVKAILWHQGETGNGNATYLTKLFSVYDTLIRHNKVNNQAIMIVGDYSELTPSAPHIPIDSLRYGIKDLGGRRIFVANYQHRYADQLYDLVHFDVNFMLTVGEGYYSTWSSRQIELQDLSSISLDAAYNNSGSTPTITNDSNGGSNGLTINSTGANGIIFDLQNTTGTARFKGIRSGIERSTWFRQDGRVVFNSSAPNVETPFAAANSAAVIVDMGLVNESNIWLNGNNSARVVVENHSSTPDAGIWGVSSRGSASSPSFTLNNDKVFYFSSRGWAGGANTTYVEGAGIEFRANGDWNFSNRSHNIYFRTNTTNTSSAVDRMRIGDRVFTLSPLDISSSLYETQDRTESTSPINVLSTDRYININATVAISTVLPTATDGLIIDFRRTDNTANVITFQGTVDGIVNPTSSGASSPIAALNSQFGSVTLRGNGTSWEVWKKTSSAAADNLGNHIATQALNLNGNQINNASVVNSDSCEVLNGSFRNAPTFQYQNYTATGTLNRELAHYWDGTTDDTLTTSTVLPDETPFFVKNKDAVLLLTVLPGSGHTMDGDGRIYPGEGVWFQRHGTVIERISIKYRESVSVHHTDFGTAVTTGIGVMGYEVPAQYDGWNIVEVSYRTHSAVSVANLDVQLSRQNSAGSSTGTFSSTIVSGNRFVKATGSFAVSEGDLLMCQVPAIGTSVATGLTMTIVLAKP